MTQTFIIGYHTFSNAHGFLAIAETGAIPFADFADERDVRDAYIGVLVDGVYKERAVSYKRAMRLAHLLDSKSR